MKRVVALRALGLGDLMTGAPSLRALRRRFGSSQLVLLAPAWQAPIARWFGVDAVVPYEELGPVPSALDGSALAVDLHGSGCASADPLLAGRHDRIVAYAGAVAARTEGGQRGGTVHAVPWRRDEHELDRWARLLDAVDITTCPDDLYVDLDPRPARHRDLVIVHPGAAAPARRWPVERFGELVGELSRRGLRVMLTGTAAERPLCREVERIAAATIGDLDAGGVTNLAGTTDPVELVGLVAASRLVVSGDTGIAHVAIATRTPSVVLFGPTPPAWWGPRSGPHRVLWSGRSGDPHGRVVDPGLASITVPDVLAALDDVAAASSVVQLGRRTARSPSPG